MEIQSDFPIHQRVRPRLRGVIESKPSHRFVGECEMRFEMKFISTQSRRSSHEDVGESLRLS